MLLWYAIPFMNIIFKRKKLYKRDSCSCWHIDLVSELIMPEIIMFITIPFLTSFSWITFDTYWSVIFVFNGNVFYPNLLNCNTTHRTRNLQLFLMRFHCHNNYLNSPLNRMCRVFNPSDNVCYDSIFFGCIIYTYLLNTVLFFLFHFFRNV